ncbi:MAG: hypothetical protein ABL934_00470 [Lysobacteraceae bacterium]
MPEIRQRENTLVRAVDWTEKQPLQLMMVASLPAPMTLTFLFFQETLLSQLQVPAGTDTVPPFATASTALCTCSCEQVAAVTVSACAGTNVAVAVLAALIATVHNCSLPLHAPLHPVKALPAAGVAVNTTEAPASKFALQLEPHWIPDGAETIAPFPLTTVSSRFDDHSGGCRPPVILGFTTAGIDGDAALSSRACALGALSWNEHADRTATRVNTTTLRAVARGAK